MKGGGWNAENSQLSDGRRVGLQKCQKCDNRVRLPGAHLCTRCDLQAFDARITRNRASAMATIKRRPRDAIGRLSHGMGGLLESWFWK